MPLVLSIQGESEEGPFGFITEVGDMTVDLLNQGLPAATPVVATDVIGRTVTLITQTGTPGADGAAGAPGADGAGAAAVEPDLDGLYATDSGSEDLLCEDLSNFATLSSGTRAVSVSAIVRAIDGATGTFRVRLGGTDGAADGTLMATITTTSSTFETVTATGTVTNPNAVRTVKLTGQSSSANKTIAVKATLVRIT